MLHCQPVDNYWRGTGKKMTQSQRRMSSFAVFRLLLPLYLVVAVGPLNTVGTFNLIPVFSEDFGVSLSLAGLAVTLYMIPFVISQVASGAVTEMLGAGRALFVGFLIFSVSCLIAALTTSYASDSGSPNFPSRMRHPRTGRGINSSSINVYGGGASSVESIGDGDRGHSSSHGFRTGPRSRHRRPVRRPTRLARILLLPCSSGSNSRRLCGHILPKPFAPGKLEKPITPPATGFVRIEYPSSFPGGEPLVSCECRRHHICCGLASAKRFDWPLWGRSSHLDSRLSGNIYCPYRGLFGRQVG